MIKTISAKEIRNNKLNKLGENSITDFDYFASLDYCSTYFDENNLLYFYSNNFAVLIRIVKKYFFRYALFLSEIQKKESVCEADEKEFLNEIVGTLTKKYKVQWIAQTPTHCVFNTFPSKSKVIPFATYQIDLDQPEELIFSNFNSKHRNVIRRAIKESVVVKFGGIELIDDYMIMDSQTWERSGVSSRKKDYYECLLTHSKHVLVAIAYDLDGKPQAGAIVPYTKRRAYYLHGCTLNNSLLGSANLLQWEIIKWLKSKGIKIYDFVGCRLNVDEDSKFHGIQRFKERFGGKLRKGYMFKTIISGFMYRLYKSLISIREKKKFLDVIDQEIHKWSIGDE